MRLDRDCLPVAISNATGLSYEKCYKACHHMDLPFFLESPILANPYNAVRSIRAVGFDPDDTITINDLTPEMTGKVIILVHNPDSPVRSFIDQHWVVWYGFDPLSDRHKILWGTSQKFKYIANVDMKSLFLSGWPNCAILIKEV